MKMIAHRGLSALYPENSLLAFSKAIEAGVDGIETDVRLSSDNIAFLFHDDTLQRIAALNKAPESLCLLELKALNTIGNEPIATLQELLNLTNKKTTLILEIKYNPTTYKKLCHIIEQDIKDKLLWVEVSCFEDKVLEYMHAINPKIKLHKLIEDKELLEDVNLKEKYPYVSFYDIDITLSKEVLDLGLLQKYKIIFWTVDKEDVSQYREAGLYGIMKNNPLT